MMGPVTRTSPSSKVQFSLSEGTKREPQHRKGTTICLG